MQVFSHGVVKRFNNSDYSINQQNVVQSKYALKNTNHDVLTFCQNSIKPKSPLISFKGLISFGQQMKESIEHKVLLQSFYNHVGTIEDIQSTKYLAEWDNRRGDLPENAGAARSHQTSTIENLMQEKIRDTKFGKLMTKLLENPEKLSRRDLAIIKYWHRIHTDAVNTGTKRGERLSKAIAETIRVYEKAKEQSNFKEFEPYLKDVIKAKKDIAKAIDPDKSVYNAMLDRFEPGMTTEKLDKLFGRLKAEIIAFKKKIEAVKSSEPARDANAEKILNMSVNPAKAQQFYQDVLKDMGFNFNRGKMVATKSHPRSFKVSSPYDVRISIPANDGDLKIKDFKTQLLCAMHEAGHGLVHQKADEALARTGMCDASDALHESQALLWENIVGSGLPFWKHYYPELQEICPELKKVPLEDFYKAINKVESSLIRIKADEVTYNLHPVLRYEIERSMFEAKDDTELDEVLSKLPETWNNKMNEYLGIKPSNDKEGALQDVHWSIGFIGGYFTTYALGNIFSAQFYNAAKTDLAKKGINLEEEISSGNLNVLTDWLTEKIYKEGRTYTTPEVMKNATGEDINIEHFIKYMKDKYSKIYDL